MVRRVNKKTMKNILFCLQTMVCGGVEKELITILKRFDRTKYKLSVLLMYEQDMDILKMIPEDVEVIKLNIDKDYFCSNTSKLITERVKKGRLYEALKLGVSRVIINDPAPKSISLEQISAQEEYYDYAVCYHLHSPIVLRYVDEKVKATKKIAWIHNDFTTTGYKIEKYHKWLSQYDLFVGVSRKLTEEFVTICPQYEGITQTVHNIVDESEIQEKAMDMSNVEETFLQDKRFKIVTVGRFVEQKGFDIAVSACAYLKRKGMPVVWYAIGYGQEEDLIINLVREKGIENEFVILGRKENPYPFINLANLYLQTSRHEGYAITIEEAKALKKVIVCTNFAGASEQINNGINGIVVPKFTAEAVGEAILHIYYDENYRSKLQESIQNEEQQDNWKKIEDVFKI